MMELTRQQLDILIEIVKEKSDQLHQEVMKTEDPAARIRFSEVIKIWTALVRCTQYTVSINISGQDKGGE